MAHRPYNTTFTAYYGPNSVKGPPNQPYRMLVPCRVVYQHEISQLIWPESLCVAWVTYDAPQLNFCNQTALVGQAIVNDYAAADRLSIASLTDDVYVVMRSEIIITVTEPFYYRCLICDTRLLPPPPPPPPPGPGSTCDDATQIMMGQSVSSAPPGPDTQQWWYFSRPPGTTVHVNMTGVLSSGSFMHLLVGSSCDSQVQQAVYTTDACFQYAGPFPLVWVFVTGGMPDGPQYTLDVESGPCGSGDFRLFK